MKDIRAIKLWTQDNKDSSNVALWLFIVSSIAVGFIAMGAAFWVSLDKDVRDPGITNWQGALGIQILIAIGTSIFASLIFYFLYSQSAEKKILADISESSTEYAFSLFAKRFDKLLPAKIIPERSVPSAEFEREFRSHLDASTTYKYKGDAARLVSYRLTNLYRSSHQLERDVTLLLLDPRNETLLRELVEMNLSKLRTSFTKKDVTEKTTELRNDIYTTIVIFYDNCQRQNVEISFHNEQLFFRTEIFDDGMFLSYYLGKGFPDTYFYKKDTLSYDSYLMNFRQNHKVSNKIIHLNMNLTEESLLVHLSELGCKFGLDELRVLADLRVRKYKKLLENVADN